MLGLSREELSEFVQKEGIQDRVEIPQDEAVLEFLSELPNESPSD